MNPPTRPRHRDHGTVAASPKSHRRGRRRSAAIALAALGASLCAVGPAQAQVAQGQTPAARDNLEAGDVVPPGGTQTQPVFDRSEIPLPSARDASPNGAGSGAATPGPLPRRPAYSAPIDSDPATHVDNGAGPSMSGPLASPNSVGPTAPGTGEVFGPSATPETYGPPTPKAKHGRLAELDWPKAPPQVPGALEDAVNIVTRNYPSAKSARAALRAAASDVSAARWQRFPSFSANAAFYDSDGSPEPQGVVEMPIWSGGRIGADIRRAKATEDSSSAAYVETVNQLALTTAQTYFDIVRLTEREQLLAASLKEHMRLVGTIERRVKQEVSPLADLELARSRTAQVEQNYNVTHAQRLTSLRIMAQLVADPGYDLGPIPYFDPNVTVANPDALEQQAAVYSPQLRRLSAEVDVARAELSSRRASILPQLNAQYSYDEIYGHRVGAVVRAQNDGGLSQFSQVNSARLRIDAAQEDLHSADEQLRRQVASDLIEFQAAKSRATISGTAADTADRVSESYMRQFIAGRRSWLDVMNALREAVDAEIGRSEAEVTAMGSSVRLLIESGRWRPRFDPAR